MFKTQHEGIYYRPLKDGRKVYYVRIRLHPGAGGRKKFRAGFRISDALALQAKLRTAKSEGRLGILIKPAKITFAKLAEEYWQAYATRAKPRNWPRTRSILRTLCRHFGPMRLLEIGPREIEAYVERRRASGKLHRTTNAELVYFKTAMNMAVEWGYLDRAPRVRMLPTPGRGKARILNDDELAAVLAQASDDHAVAVRIAVNTGMRLGEIFRITREDLDRETRTLHVPETKTEHPRDLPLMPDTAELILRQLVKHKGRMFPQPTEQRLSYRFTYERSHRIKNVAPWRFHDLRHNFATALIRAGVDIRTVMYLTGHRSIKALLIYLHEDLEIGREAIEKIMRAQNGPILSLRIKPKQ